MRLVQVTIPTGKRETVLDVLDDEEIEYAVTAEDGHGDYTAVATFPLPTGAVEPILDRLRDAGLPEEAMTVVLDAETVISRRFATLEERYDREEEHPNRISREEIQARANDLTPEFSAYLLLTIVSVIVATAGILLDSAAVVVGSMVIAPLIGPAMATSVGTVIDDRELFGRGVRYQFYGLVIGIVAAAGFALLIKTVNLVPPGIELFRIGQLRERLTPDFLSLAVALGAGVAGAFSLSAGVSAALVGVMIAVALVPPVAVVGIGLAWGEFGIVVGAAVLALVNFLSINLAALVTLYYQGYRPESWFRRADARSATIKRVAVLVVAIVVLSSVLGAVTYSSYRTATIQGEVREDVHAVLEEPGYAELELLELTVETELQVVLQTPERVSVTLGRPPGGRYPQLADRLADRIGHGLSVEVRYVEVDVATA